jgi:hypothetical protein
MLKEIGWFPAERVPEASPDNFDGLPARFDAFHWNAETILAAPPEVFRRLRREMFDLLDNLSAAGSPRDARKKKCP